MPDLVVGVTATGTGVGKTWLCAALARNLVEAGVQVGARKPVESFDPDQRPTDSEVLASATGEPVDAVCPPHRSYPVAMAPPMAADALGLPAFTIADLVRETRMPPSGVLLVEGAGGPRSPLAADGDTTTLADALGALVWVLVADAGLGAINGVLTSVEALRSRPVVVFLNRFDPSIDVHARNWSWLKERERLQLFADARELALYLSELVANGLTLDRVTVT